MANARVSDPHCQRGLALPLATARPGTAYLCHDRPQEVKGAEVTAPQELEDGGGVELAHVGTALNPGCDHLVVWAQPAVERVVKHSLSVRVGDAAARRTPLLIVELSCLATPAHGENR